MQNILEHIPIKRGKQKLLWLGVSCDYSIQLQYISLIGCCDNLRFATTKYLYIAVYTQIAESPLVNKTATSVQ